MDEIPEQLNAAVVLVDSHVRQGRGEKPAILCGDEVVTYRALAESVNRLGNSLRALGVRHEQRVALLLLDTPAFAYSFFAAMKIGAVPVPLNTMFKPHDYEYLLNDSRARVLIVSASLMDHIEPIRKQLKYLEHVIVAGDDARGVVAPGDHAPGDHDLDGLMRQSSPNLDPAETSKDDTAFWLYSSGTTGRPKAAIHLHHDMLVIAENYGRQTIGLRESDVTFSVAKLFFAYGLGNGLYLPLSVGATTILLPDRPTPERVWEVIDRHQPTVFFGVPTGYAVALQSAETLARTSLGRVRMCVSAGEPLPKPIYETWLERFGVEILDGIGSTEVLHIFISNRPGQSKPGSTGRIVSGFEARLIDDGGQEVPEGEEGLLLIKGDSTAIGYWNKHQQSKATFLGDWVNTHDKFRIDQDGFFWYGGRADDLIKVSGQALWPCDLENLLHGHPAVLECGVAGLADEHGLLKPHAFVVLKDGYQASDDLARELQEFVKKHTAPYKYPRRVEFVAELPRTATGKIQRYRLREMRP